MYVCMHKEVVVNVIFRSKLNQLHCATIHAQLAIKYLHKRTLEEIVAINVINYVLKPLHAFKTVAV